MIYETEVILLKHLRIAFRLSQEPELVGVSTQFEEVSCDVVFKGIGGL